MEDKSSAGLKSLFSFSISNIGLHLYCILFVWATRYWIYLRIVKLRFYSSSRSVLVTPPPPLRPLLSLTTLCCWLKTHPPVKRRRFYHCGCYSWPFLLVFSRPFVRSACCLAWLRPFNEALVSHRDCRWRRFVTQALLWPKTRLYCCLLFSVMVAADVEIYLFIIQYTSPCRRQSSKT